MVPSALPDVTRGGSGLTDVSWDPAGELDRDQWVSVGEQLGRLERGSPWWVGDWLAYGERRYGSTYDRAGEITGLSYQRLANRLWVAQEFEFSRRRENLTWSHHEAVAGLPPADQERLLDLAESERWNYKRLRSAASTAKHVNALKTTEKPTENKGAPDHHFDAATGSHHFQARILENNILPDRGSSDATGEVVDAVIVTNRDEEDDEDDPDDQDDLDGSEHAMPSGVRTKRVLLAPSGDCPDYLRPALTTTVDVPAAELLPRWVKVMIIG